MEYGTYRETYKEKENGTSRQLANGDGTYKLLKKKETDYPAIFSL